MVRGAWWATVHRVAESGGTEVTEHTRVGSRKMVLTSLFSGQQWGLRENRLGDTEREE